MKSFRFLKFISTIMVVFVIINCFINTLLIAKVKKHNISDSLGSYTDNTYIDYKKSFSDSSFGSDEIILNFGNYSENLSKKEKVFKKFKVYERGALLTEEEGTVGWSFEIKDEGLYNITINYFKADGNIGFIKRRLLLDGKVPFNEVDTIELKRSFKTLGDTKYDLQGNEVRPLTEEIDCIQSVTLSDLGGYTEENYCFFLSRGKHTLELESLMGRLAIDNIKIHSVEATEDYLKVSSDYNNITPVPEGFFKKIQGENYIAKSDESILTQNDRTSAATEPYSDYQIVYNTIGAGTWANAGQWIEWEIDVPKDGLYCLGARWRQNTKLGSVSSRILSIDGEVPFKEAEDLTFSYSNSWQIERFGENDPYLFYLSKGKHTVRLTVNYGEMAEILSETADIITSLNDIYLRIIMITGASPDLKRDYNFKAQIPETIEQFSTVSNEIEALILKIDNITQGNQSTNEMERAADTLQLMYDDPETIAKRLSNFQSNISALATWLSDNRKQPLEIDYLFVSDEDSRLPKASGGLLASIILQLKQLLGSYAMDYTTIGSTSEVSNKEETLTVWMTCGTEQANIVQRMINEDFIPKKEISVKAQNVSLGALMPALLASRGPDVMLNMDEATPVNYALRGAIYNLSNFSDIDEVLSKYNNCTYESFRFNNGVYALPTTVDYPVLFYRADIIRELDINLKDLEVWDNVLQVVLPKIQTKNLYFGLTASMNSYLMFYYQQGGKLYNEKTNHILLDSKESINAFADYTSIYKEYKQKLTFSFVNLFRSGEMPIAVMPFSQYFQLSVFAPEIEGLWDILAVPGTINDNILDRSAACTVTGAAIMAKAKNPKMAWEFLKWWTGDSAQMRYASEAETLLGMAGRVNVANNTARAIIDWPLSTRKVLNLQLEHCDGVPQVPGSYYASRYFDFAFRDVLYSGADNIQTLISATEDINAEIDEKKTELLQ